MSNDVNRLRSIPTTGTYLVNGPFSTFVHYLVLGPIQAVIIAYIMWTHLGWSAFVGVALLVPFIPFQLIMGRLFSRFRQMTAKLTDGRLRLMNEIISGMRVIKMYAWEQPFADLVADARKSEVGRIQRSCLLKAINLSLFFVASRVILFAAFITYVLTGNLLTAKAVFVTMALFNTLRITLTLLFPNAIAQWAELKVSCSRIQTFLELGEMEPKTYNTKGFGDLTAFPKKNAKPKVFVNNISAKWSEDTPYATIQNISFNLKPGDLLAVIGPVGAGKSSLIMSILNELPVLEGSVQTVGTISYASQEPW
ncbi:unnamed protein product, partial [Oppiella nova]